MMQILTKSAIIIGVGLILQSCSIPAINTKESNVALPENYALQPPISIDGDIANMDWNTFFDDHKLTALIDTAVAENKEVNIMAQRISIAKNEVLARKGEYKPFVVLGAGADVDKVGSYTRNGAVEENLNIKEGKAFPEYLQNYQFGLNASWELDVWKKLRNSTKAATLEYLASVEGRKFLITNLVAEIANSYYELESLDNQLVNIDKNINIQLQALKVVKALQAYGETTSLAVKRFEAEVKKNQSHQYNIKQAIVEVENRINFLLGRPQQPIARSSSSFMTTPLKVVSSGVPSQLLENRPDIRQAELELSAAKLNIKVAKANFYPSFSIHAGLGFQAFNPKYLINMPESLMASLGGDMLAPLINRNAIIATYKNASAHQIQAAYEYEQTIINAYIEVANQLSNIDNLNHSYQIKQQQVLALTESVDIASQLFKSAHADYLEVLLTQREALEANNELIETREKQISAMVNLYRALGGGWKQKTKVGMLEQKQANSSTHH